MLADIFERRRILVCVGAGGVGKTTTAAALALSSALAGRKTLVLTIDPARRLANSLGLAELGHDVQRVDDALLDEAARSVGSERAPGGELHAMMLDQKRAFDELVESQGQNPEVIKRIMANPVYAQISESLAGAQEYAAMIKLREFDAAGTFETIVVDTPPTAHALDFLDAPEKLTMAIDSPAIEWFRKIRGSRGGWSVVGSTGSYIIKRLAKFVGSQFIDDLAVFFTDFNDVLGGFRTRAEETFEALRRDHVGFLLVSSPEPMAIDEAVYFHSRLDEASMHFDGFIINRLHRDLPLRGSEGDLSGRIAAHPGVAELGYQESTIRIATETMLDCHRELQVLAAADASSLARLEASEHDIVKVPLQSEDVHDLSRLARIGRFLVG